MLQRTTILDAWEDAKSPGWCRGPARLAGGGAEPLQLPQQRAQTFMAMVREQEALCWEDLVAEFRENYYDSFAELIPPLFTDDRCSSFPLHPFCRSQPAARWRSSSNSFAIVIRKSTRSA